MLGLLGDALADLEGGYGGIITSSGMSAIAVVGHLLPQGARIVAPHDCYGGTYRLFAAWQRRGELTVDFVDFGDAQALAALFALKEDESVSSIPEFQDLMKEKGDKIHKLFTKESIEFVEKDEHGGIKRK